MRSKAFRWILGGLGLFFVLASLIITYVEYTRFTVQPLFFPAGSRIADVPVDRLDAPAAQSRLAEFFALPLLLTIEDDTIHADPADLGFNLDPAALATEAASPG